MPPKKTAKAKAAAAAAKAAAKAAEEKECTAEQEVESTGAAETSAVVAEFVTTTPAIAPTAHMAHVPEVAVVNTVVSNTNSMWGKSTSLAAASSQHTSRANSSSISAGANYTPPPLTTELWEGKICDILSHNPALNDFSASSGLDSAALSAGQADPVSNGKLCAWKWGSFDPSPLLAYRMATAGTTSDKMTPASAAAAAAAAATSGGAVAGSNRSASPLPLRSDNGNGAHSGSGSGSGNASNITPSGALSSSSRVISLHDSKTAAANALIMHYYQNHRHTNLGITITFPAPTPAAVADTDTASLPPAADLETLNNDTYIEPAMPIESASSAVYHWEESEAPELVHTGHRYVHVACMCLCDV